MRIPHYDEETVHVEYAFTEHLSEEKKLVYTGWDGDDSS